MAQQHTTMLDTFYTLFGREKVDNLIKSQVDLPLEAAEVLRDHYWDLLDASPDAQDDEQSL